MIPELVDIGAARKVLPPGRYACTLDEIREKYVPDEDLYRVAIWDSFLAVVTLVENAVGGLAEMWIGGSFITSEKSPHDIDVVFFFKEAMLKTIDSKGIFVINVLSRNKNYPRRLSERVDGYMIVVPPTEFENNLSCNYTPLRGYWDQFWSKTRFENDDKRWLYPAAGYLEVMMDGYDD